MVYGAEAVLPSDIRHDSPRVTAYIEADNGTAWQDALDRLDEVRDIAAARSAIYSRIFIVITVAESEPEPFRKEIWCFGSSKIRLICISYPHLGRGLSWSARICTMGHTI